jgi:peptidoglycan/xylan/chitin deacetylase (PgdA/CDA1 family)
LNIKHNLCIYINISTIFNLMDAIQNNLNNHFRICGMQHFTQRYGIPLDTIKYVEVSGSPLEERIVSWIKTAHGEVPLFEDIKGKPYIQETAGQLKINFSAYEAIGRILSGHLETLPPEEKKRISKIPIVDIYEQILFDALTDASLKQGKILTSKPYWPDNKKFAVCLTHDVDEARKTYQYFTRAFSNLKKGKIINTALNIKDFLLDKASGKNPYWTFDYLMNLENELGVRSSFYFLQEDGKVELLDKSTWKHEGRRYHFNDPKIKAIMHNLVSKGWEVGLHGSYYSYNNRDKLLKEKKELEESLGTPVYGIRQHNLNLELPDTLMHHESIGFEYDTSLGYKAATGCSGFRGGTCFPFQPFNAKENRPIAVLELSLNIMDTTLLQKNKEEAWKEIAEIIDAVEKQGGLLTILFHHSAFNEKDYPGYTDIYKRIINACMQKNAWIVTGKEICTWWKTR